MPSFFRIEAGKVVADNFVLGVAHDPNCARVPIHYVPNGIEHEHRMVPSAFDHQLEHCTLSHRLIECVAGFFGAGTG